MTIYNRELNERLTNLEQCAELAPDGTYDEAKRAVGAVNEAIEAVRAAIREAGFKINGSDPCRDLEAAIYGYLLVSNPDAYGLMTGEGFGKSMDSPKRGLLIAKAAANRDAFTQAIRR
jgi:hypothetical protein